MQHYLVISAYQVTSTDSLSLLLLLLLLSLDQSYCCGNKQNETNDPFQATKYHEVDHFTGTINMLQLMSPSTI